MKIITSKNIDDNDFLDDEEFEDLEDFDSWKFLNYSFPLLSFDELSNEEEKEALTAASIVKEGAVKFMYEIKNNPDKYPNLSQLKSKALVDLFPQVRTKIKENELIDQRFITAPTGLEWKNKRNINNDEMKDPNETALANSKVRIFRTAEKTQIKLSKSEWESIGKKAGWLKIAQTFVCPECGGIDVDLIIKNPPTPNPEVDDAHCNKCHAEGPQKYFMTLEQSEKHKEYLEKQRQNEAWPDLWNNIANKKAGWMKTAKTLNLDKK